MPLYEYQCVKCKRRTEKIETVAGPHLKKCPHCGGKVEQTLTAPAIQFKGSGWYVTDYAGKNSAATPSEGSGDSSAKSEDKSAEKSADSKKETKTESKPAAASESSNKGAANRKKK